MFERFTDGKDRIQNLRKLNIGLGVIHLVQALLIFSISRSYAFEIKTEFPLLETDPITGLVSFVTQTNVIGDVKLSALVGIFLFIAAITHFLISTPGVEEWYEKNLKKGIGYARWFEYALSSSFMIITLSLIVGINDLKTLIAIFTLNALMNLFGLLMEIFNSGKKKNYNWWPFNLGILAGIIPWILILINCYLIRINGGFNPQIAIVMIVDFFWFTMFALNMYLGFKKVGRWENYYYVEVVYSFLSLAAKSILAWSLFSMYL